ncbi:hypothetical protein KEM55_004275 [Ascosphaera atra]|nr:hypothetical protein KEM55_004275 [Ascosphaera atra]
MATTTTASPALCFYCFEVLAGAFQEVQPPRLAALQTLYEEYTKDLVEQEKQRKRQQQQPLNVLVDVDAEKWKVTISTWRDLATATPPAKKISSGDGDDNGTGNAWAAGTSLATKLAETSATEYPLFVTWNVLSADGAEKRLRGCIGTFEPQALEFGLNSFTIQSCVHFPSSTSISFGPC